MTTESSNTPSAVQVTPQPAVDVHRPAGEEPSMAEYAKKLNAELRGEQYEVKPAKPAATSVESTTAAATEATSAAATIAATTSAAETDPLEQIEEAHVAKKGIQKRFGELTAEREAAKREAEQAKREAAEAKAEVERIKAEQIAAAEAAKAAPVVPVVPKAEDDPAPAMPVRTAFDDPDAYDAAFQQFVIDNAAHASRQEIRKATAAAEAARAAAAEETRKAAEADQQVKVQAQIIELHKNFNERVEKARTDYPDFEAKVTNNENLTLRNDVFFAIERAELAPHILYHLANHPEEVTSLNQLHPSDAAMRIGELQADLRIARKPKVSQAAEPVKPVGSRASPERKTSDEMSVEEYAAKLENEGVVKSRTAQKRRVAN